MAAGLADACWDESISKASDSDMPSDEESQVLLFFIRILMKSILRSSKNAATALSLANPCSLCNPRHSTSVSLLK